MGSGLKGPRLWVLLGVVAVLVAGAVAMAAKSADRGETPTEAANAIKSKRTDLPTVPKELLAHGVGGGAKR